MKLQRDVFIAGVGETTFGRHQEDFDALGRQAAFEAIMDGRIQKGDVLVTPSIDPGQTLAFSVAGAIVLEVGGMLSHGAILAREFGIPTVGGVMGAVDKFRDGQMIEVDGNTGMIRTFDDG